MLLSRRLLLFLPVAILTPLFLALGWRNWNLSTNEDEIFAAIAADFRDTAKRPTDPFALGRIYIPFIDNEVTVVGKKQGQTIVPLSDALMARLKRSYPKAHLKNSIPSNRASEFHFYFEEVNFRDRFRAKCKVFYCTQLTKFVSPTESNSSQTEIDEDFSLRRSPVNLFDSTWKIEGSHADIPQIVYPPQYPFAIP